MLLGITGIKIQRGIRMIKNESTIATILMSARMLSIQKILI